MSCAQSAGDATRIKVAVRLRPVNKEDKDKKLCVNGLDESSLEIWNWRNSTQTIKYSFDAFFDAASKQEDVYKKCVEPLMDKILNGQNVSIFAYGPTGAGTKLGPISCSCLAEVSRIPVTNCTPNMVVWLVTFSVKHNLLCLAIFCA